MAAGGARIEGGRRRRIAALVHVEVVAALLVLRRQRRAHFGGQVMLMAGPGIVLLELVGKVVRQIAGVGTRVAHHLARRLVVGALGTQAARVVVLVAELLHLAGPEARIERLGAHLATSGLGDARDRFHQPVGVDEKRLSAPPRLGHFRLDLVQTSLITVGRRLDSRPALLARLLRARGRRRVGLLLLLLLRRRRLAACLELTGNQHNLALLLLVVVVLEDSL